MFYLFLVRTSMLAKVHYMKFVASTAVFSLRDPELYVLTRLTNHDEIFNKSYETSKRVQECVYFMLF